MQHSVQIEFRGKDKVEIRNAAKEFDQILEKVSEKLQGKTPVKKSFVDKDANISYNFFIAALLEETNYQRLLTFIKENSEEKLGNNTWNMILNLSITIVYFS